jgi:imidazolonepropionase-like amidohydrolase
MLGVEDRGELASGLLADIIAVQGDPLVDVRVLEDVLFVMKGGKVFKQPPDARQVDGLVEVKR